MFTSMSIFLFEIHACYWHPIIACKAPSIYNATKSRGFHELTKGAKVDLTQIMWHWILWKRPWEYGKLEWEINLTLKKNKKKKWFVKPWGHDSPKHSPTKSFGLRQICCCCCCCWRRRRMKEGFLTTSGIGIICGENGWESATTQSEKPTKERSPKKEK